MPPFIFICIAVAILLLVSGGYVFTLACCGKKNVDWLDEACIKKSPYGMYYEYICASHQWLKEKNARDIYITSYDGLRLHGFWIPAENPRGTVLMAHGYRSTMLLDFHLPFELFHRLGMNILVPEQRTHGESQGRFITFGVKESRDMENWLSYYHRELGKWPVLLYGISMGASTMLYLADRCLPADVQGIIADCGFTSPAEIIGSVFKRVIHLPAKSSLWIANGFAKILAGFSFWQKDTRKSVKRNRYPILFIHGEGDGFVPLEMTEQTFAACTGKKKLFTVPQAEHGLSFLTDGYGYTAAVIDFLKDTGMYS